MPRRRPQYPVPGQTADFNVLGSRYNIRRQPDEIFVEGRRVRRRNVNVRGGQTHIHVHTGRPRRREAATQQIDFEARRRELEAKMERRRKQIAALIRMPGRTPEEIQRNVPFGQAQAIRERAEAFRDKLHPVRSAFNKWSPVTYVKKAKEKNKPWYAKIFNTVNGLIPINIGMGIGRKSKRGQVRAFEADTVRTARGLENTNFRQRAQATLDAYLQRINNAFADFQATGNSIVFERAVDDAEKWFDAQVSAGLISDYRRETGRKGIEE